MDLARLGELADSVEAIVGAIVLIVGGIFSPRLWRAAKRVALGIHRFVAGVGLIADLHPVLADLPAQLDDTRRKVASLENTMSLRTETHEQLNTQLATLVEQVRRIDHQVHPNGGKSLNDMVRGVARELGEVRASQHVTHNVLRISWDALGTFGVFYTDTAGDNTYCSSAYLKWVNRTEREMAGYGWVNAVHPDDRTGVVAEWEACLRDERDFAMDYRMLRVDGAVFAVHTSASPLRSEGGEIIQWVGMVRRTDQ
jgi:PAS domain S-box-containing protein